MRQLSDSGIITSSAAKECLFLLLFVGALVLTHTHTKVWAVMTDNKRLAFSIIQFLHDQLQSGNLSSGAQESLEGESSLNSK